MGLWSLALLEMAVMTPSCPFAVLFVEAHSLSSVHFGNSKDLLQPCHVIRISLLSLLLLLSTLLSMRHRQTKTRSRLGQRQVPTGAICAILPKVRDKGFLASPEAVSHPTSCLFCPFSESFWESFWSFCLRFCFGFSLSSSRPKDISCSLPKLGQFSLISCVSAAKPGSWPNVVHSAPKLGSVISVISLFSSFCFFSCFSFSAFLSFFRFPFAFSALSVLACPNPKSLSAKAMSENAVSVVASKFPALGKSGVGGTESMPILFLAQTRIGLKKIAQKKNSRKENPSSKDYIYIKDISVWLCLTHQPRITLPRRSKNRNKDRPANTANTYYILYVYIYIYIYIYTHAHPSC